MNAGGAIEGEARPSLPPSQRIPTPPALPSRRGSPAVTARRASLPITPVSPSDRLPSSSSPWSTHNTAMHPAAVRPLPTPPTMPGSAASHIAPPPMSLGPLSPVSPSTVARNMGYTRSMTHKPPGMDTVPEDGAADASEYVETRSLHQLPSPPLSPDEPHVDPRRRGSSVSSSRRPSVVGRQGASNALPTHRPRSSTGPSVALPLTAAFQTSVLRSGSGTSSSVPPSSFGQGQRYATFTSSSPPPRSRPSSVSVSSALGPPRPLPSPLPVPDADGNMPRPVTESFRRMSTTDIRTTRHQLSSSSRPGSPSREGPSRVFMRSPASPGSEAATSGTSSRPSSSHRHAVVHTPPPLPSIGLGAGGSVVPSSFAPPSSLPLSPTSPPSLSPAATSVSASTGPQLLVHTHSHSHARTPGMGSAHPHPSTVNWKSLASGSRASVAPSSSQNPSPSAYPSVPRSRSNSVRSVRTLPVPPPHLPALDALPPLSMALKDAAEEDRGEGSSRRGRP
ncbi:hypothetical protein V8D89_003236 [Ganoderma adspersum]